MTVEGWVAIIGALSTAIVAIITALRARQENKAMRRALAAHGLMTPPKD